MPHPIKGVTKDSPADKAGIKTGERLISINDEHIKDFIDFQDLCANKTLMVKTDKGCYHIHKARFDELGLDFENYMMSGIRNCANKCIFCFVDQLPENARDSLRVKDDDWRLSLLTGSYVTLTNVGNNELSRIIKRHASPLYISVHSMNGELRAKMLNSKRGADIASQLNKLAEGGISFHTQAVLCPGINDGAELERTINELIELYPACLTLALVPVGLTTHREGLCRLRKYTRDEARSVIEIANRYRAMCLEKLGTRFVFPSDEFYLEAEMPLPEDDEYEDYGQIDDGVGMLRLFATEFDDAATDTPVKLREGVRPLIACGKSAEAFFTALMLKYDLPVKVKAVRNTFFGEIVTVSGLIPGHDLVDQIKNTDCSHVLISECALRAEDNVFIDDLPLSEAIELLGKPIIPVGRSGSSLIDALNAL